MAKRKITDFKPYDSVDYITNEEYAKGHLMVQADSWEGMDVGTPEDVDRAWERVKLGSERHGWAITPAVHDAYAEARAIACAHHAAATEPAFA